MNVNMLIYLMVFLPMAGALLSYLTGRKTKQGRDYVVSGIAVLEFILSVLLVVNVAGKEGTVVEIAGICGMGLRFTVDGFRVIYGSVAAFMWMIPLV